MRLAALVFILWPIAGFAQTCTLGLSVLTEAAHGTLASGTRLAAEVTFVTTRRMRMGSETTSYLTDGSVVVSGPDGTALNGRLKVIHVVRAAHWADYMSFDVVDVTGNLGGVTSYEDPMLFSFYADRGELTSFDLPTTSAALEQFDRRRTFQVHTPDTMWTLPGSITNPAIRCAED